MLKDGHLFLKLVVSLFALVLVACAQNPTLGPEEPHVAEEANASAERREVESDHAVDRTRQESASEYSTLNPIPIMFEPLSVNLRDSDMQIFDAVNNRMLASEHITIRGYCDRAQVENAKEVAIERGVAVRNELVRRGFDPQRIRIRYSTETPGKHAAEIELHAD